MKKYWKYVVILIVVLGIAVGYNLLTSKTDEPTEPVSNQADAGSDIAAAITSSLTPTPATSNTPTETSTVTFTPTNTSTPTQTFTSVPTKTLTLTPAPPRPIPPTNTPGPTGEGYVGGTPWNYTQTPVYTPGAP